MQAPLELAPYAKDEAQNGDGIAPYDEIVTVTRHGRPAKSFISAFEYEKLQRYEPLARRSFATADLTPDEVEAIAKARISPKHDHLDAILDEQ